MNVDKKNFLTVDLDFLCKEIRSYNGCIPFEMMDEYDELHDNDTLWEATNLAYRLRYKKDIQMNSILKGTLEFVVNILKNNPNAEHFMVEKHNEVLGFMDDNNENTVVNIDFHHDLGYDFSTEQVQNQENNWVLWGWDEDKINSYSWIGRATSAHPTTATIPYEYLEWRDVVVDKLPKFDVIIFVRSPEYTPKEVYNTFVNCYNTLEGIKHKIPLETE